jgi:hypothetical protein
MGEAMSVESNELARMDSASVIDRGFRLFLLGMLLLAPFTAHAEDSSRPKAQDPQSDHSSPGTENIESLPYQIELHLSIDPSARIDATRRTLLINQWQALVKRFVGPPWNISVAGVPSPLASRRLQDLRTESCATFGASFDKIWLVRVSAGHHGSALHLAGREYDTATRKLGPPQERDVLAWVDAPRALLDFTLDLFNPTALITGQEGGRALLLVRGASIAPASDLGRVVEPGMVFVPLRLVTMRDHSVVIRRILFTYLRVEEAESARVRCAIVSALRDPLTQRVSRPNTLAALGIKPGSSEIRFRFVTRADHLPAAGYTLFARQVPDGLPSELGTTDRSGSIVLKPGFAPSLVVLRLVAGGKEPLVEFPIMPGESSDLREIPVDPRPLAVSLQVQLDALRDEVIDLVAMRARLEKQMASRLEAEPFQPEDGAAVEQTIKEFLALPGRDGFADRLTRLREQAQRQQAETKSPVLTKSIQTSFNELQALIDRYLDNEVINSYTEAFDRKRAEQAEAAQAANQRPSNAAGASSPPPASAPRGAGGTPPAVPPTGNSNPPF